MTIRIDTASTADYPCLLEIWSTSVLATHDFLKSEDYEEIKQQLIPAYFPAVSLYKATHNQSQKTLGFLGVLEGCVEMLFIDASARGHGVGTTLLNYAVHELGATKLDVNEQNTQAVGFYMHYGFVQTGRSDLDAAGKPYPTLHLHLPKHI
ncbi:acetyltransferase [Paenalcaligenes sp. Me52]|uniref:acetyltransferase n=1 Tax=Paenalcaligenes sp. Me52 TaxID=3392038 RepID=UPI003D2A3CA7